MENSGGAKLQIYNLKSEIKLGGLGKTAYVEPLSRPACPPFSSSERWGTEAQTPRPPSSGDNPACAVLRLLPANARGTAVILPAPYASELAALAVGFLTTNIRITREDQAVVIAIHGRQIGCVSDENSNSRGMNTPNGHRPHHSPCSPQTSLSSARDACDST